MTVQPAPAASAPPAGVGLGAAEAITTAPPSHGSAPPARVGAAGTVPGRDLPGHAVPVHLGAMSSTKPTVVAFSNPPVFSYSPTFQPYVNLWQTTNFYLYLGNT